MYSDTRFKKTVLLNAVLLALSIHGIAMTLNSNIAQAADAACADAVTTDRANFTMLDSAGYLVGGTNDVAWVWNGRVYTDSSDYTGPGSAANVTASSTQPFFGHAWTAHDIQVFAPGSYTFDATLGGGATESGTLSATVDSGQLGIHMLFDWNGNNNIDVFEVVNLNSAFGSGIARGNLGSSTQIGCTSTSQGGQATIQNCLWDSGAYVAGNSANAPLGSTVWMFSSSVGNADGVMGVPMPSGGPFQGFNANFNVLGTYANPTGACVAVVDTTPDPYVFTSKTNADLSTQYEANAMFTPPGGSPSTSLSGLGASETPPNLSRTATVTISIGGEYSKDGGATWSSGTGTASNGDTFRVRGTAPAANGQSTDIVLYIGTGSSTFRISTPAIVSAQGSNFTMIDSGNGAFGGTNDVVASWDSSCTTDVASTDFSHMALSSITPFFQNKWTAHHIRVFCPGTYTIDTTCTVAQLEAGTTTCNNPLDTAAGQTQRDYTFTVGTGQTGAHMLFNWNTATNIDVVEVWDQNQAFGPSPMYTGAGACNNPATLWNLMSTDWDNDGKNGGAMIDGPFGGFSANFNIRTSGTPLSCSAYVPTVNVADPSASSGGGCSINPTPANLLARADWWLVAGFLAWLGGIRVRLKRKIES